SNMARSHHGGTAVVARRARNQPLEKRIKVPHFVDASQRSTWPRALSAAIMTEYLTTRPCARPEPWRADLAKRLRGGILAPYCLLGWLRKDKADVQSRHCGSAATGYVAAPP